MTFALMTFLAGGFLGLRFAIRKEQAGAKDLYWIGIKKFLQDEDVEKEKKMAAVSQTNKSTYWTDTLQNIKNKNPFKRQEKKA